MKRWNLRKVSVLFIFLSVLMIAAPSYSWSGHYGHRWSAHSHYYGGRHVYRPYVRHYRYPYRPYYYAPRYRPYVVRPYPFFFTPGLSFYFSF